ncbi:MAG: RlmE family RNA methyltransferase [Halobacteriovoraceae bacterium]|nr:RlmE family RNA methyltransferase [Halobacteriovoraceae bacterium]
MSFKVKDFYYKKAKKENFLARSVYKLEEINKKFHIINKGDNVLDLGYYPGSWIQYISQVIGGQAVVVGVDIQEVQEKLNRQPNVRLFQKDINEIETLTELGVDSKFDCLTSDMAPKTTGIKEVDQARSLNLVEEVFAKMDVFLKEGGHFVIKVFEGHDAQVFLRSQKKTFCETAFFRPKSTRKVSKEYFFIGKGFQGKSS